MRLKSGKSLHIISRLLREERLKKSYTTTLIILFLNGIHFLKNKHMTTFHKISDIRFDQTFMVLNIDNQTYKINLSEVSHKLEEASDDVRNNFKISPSGYGIHWPQIDEDLSINGLIRQTQTQGASSQKSA